MTAVTIIGAGNLGGAVAALAAKAGAQVQVLARDPEKAHTIAAPLGADAGTLGDHLTGDIVVLALPYHAVSAVLDTYAGALAGKTLVDVTNPVDFATFDALVVPADSSAARIIQDAVPQATVVKAFNTNFGATLATGTAGPLATTVLIAGDDQAAKQAVAGLVTAGGLRAIDAGSLKRARELEALGFLQLTLAAGGKTPWTGGFALVG
ncbi:MAG: NAD(P)-binding domain-containing protein [Propionicimonas sp.]|uniref:NADPH-dependent F420 reductase n=1 Tax=Propionicimonas sp. TaxID=1955623 RepID=UPI002B202FAB|nr:NAD(P)-binding domain-containing protein [Propionicimonas sp.]MEA4944605.1 NAD(P)-binding domain-containing protein [Propionicimonas sp.]MEA5055596.1 NAD(P)-binding domain-containing protein [Propionicimonas sp.]MEA5117520.1 NAD(P)-binding domain-containing protein [Propionicimonas sp.]